MIDVMKMTPAWLGAVVVGAVIVLGIETYVKRFFKAKDLPWWVWHIVLIPLSALAGFSIGGTTFWTVIDSLAVLVLTQLAYKPLIALPEAWVRSATANAAYSEGFKEALGEAKAPPKDPEPLKKSLVVSTVQEGGTS